MLVQQDLHLKKLETKLEAMTRLYGNLHPQTEEEWDEYNEFSLEIVVAQRELTEWWFQLRTKGETNV